MNVRIAALFACALVLAPARSAHAQASITNHWIYDVDALEEGDWHALGSSLMRQSVRGSIALVFPDGRPPITDREQVEAWVKSGKPLRAVAFPGITGDAVSAWSMAKGIAIANHEADGKAHPVLAVNSGWTDFAAAAGTALEVASMRPVVDAGRGYKGDPISSAVAELLAARLARRPGRIAIIGHSAGGYYVANVAWLMPPETRDRLLVHNLGLATRLPPGVRAVQRLGSNDTLALVNSSSEALRSSSVQIEEGLSHLGGELWRVGDTMNSRPWKMSSLGELFPERSGRRSDSSRSRADNLRAWAKSLGDRAEVATQVAERNRSFIGASAVASLKLAHDAKLLRLDAERATTLADLQEAREQKDASAIRALEGKLEQNRSARNDAVEQLSHATAHLPRNYFTDTAEFAQMTGKEMALGLLPWIGLQKTMLGTRAMLDWSARWAQLWRSHPMNPLATQPPAYVARRGGGKVGPTGKPGKTVRVAVR